MSYSQRALCALGVALGAGLLLGPSTGAAQTTGAGASQLVTWTCSNSPCSFGPTTRAETIVWPSNAGPLATRLNYVADAGVYLPAAVANSSTVTITNGTATLFAGLPNATSHRVVATLSAGSSRVVTGLATGEVLSVQSLTGFGYEFELPIAPVPEAPAPGSPSQFVTGTCTSSPCPWGSSIGGHGIVWPATAQPLNTRLGYTFTQPVYLPAGVANGSTVWIDSGSATLLAGLPTATTHRTIATLTAGSSRTVSGLAVGEVLSVQGVSAFTYRTALQSPPPPPPAGQYNSELVTLTCVLSPCTWGPSISGQAAVWPQAAQPLSRRNNYVASKGIYLPSTVANGAGIQIAAGTVTLYAGLPEATVHRTVATLSVGNSYTVSGLAAGEVLSMHGPGAFSYSAQLSLPPPPEPGEIMHSVNAYWRCNTPGCTSPDWVGSAFTWPSWSAYSNNARSGAQSRTVYGSAGQLLYPYMGPWADGCAITAEAGVILIVEWRRGSDTWRETLLGVGETHVIELTAPEDGAIIESWPNSSISVRNCVPQPVP